MNNKIKFNYIIYHKGCQDGFSSFIVLEKSGRIDSSAVIFPDVPSAKFPPKGIDGMDVIIMDVAYKYEILKEIFLSANTVTFIDHHVTIHEDVIRIKTELDELNENKSKITIMYDEQECGATLTWKYLYGEKSLPLFLKYIKANDTGTWTRYKHTYNFMASLDVNYKLDLTKENIEKWNTMFDPNVVKKMIKRGKIYREYMDYLLDWNVNRYSMMTFPSELIYEEFSEHFKQPGQYKVALSSCPCPDSSQLGNKMMKEINCDFVMFFSQNLDRQEYVLSLRSSGVDVGSIAKMFGGGGHEFASACSIPMSKYNIEDLFMKNTLPRQKR